MSLASRFESAMQGLIEGSFGRVFRTSLQPVELSRKLERAMEDNLSLGPDRKLAPNLYDVYLSENDYPQYAKVSVSLSHQLSDALIAVARDRGYMLTSRPIVQFHEDARIITGQLRIRTDSIDAQSVALDPAAQPVSGIEETRAMSPAEAQQLLDEQSRQAAQQNNGLPPAWLTLYRPTRGQPMRLEKQTIHLGRQLNNEIVVHDRRVSRYHAEIRFEHGQFMLFDLGSTNGVKINGVISRQPTPLKNNDIVSIGSHDFVFQRR